MRTGNSTRTLRSRLRSRLVVLVLALTLVVGVAPAALAAPGDAAVAEKTSHVQAAPSAAQNVSSNAIPLLLAGIVILALLTPSPRYRHGYGYGANHHNY
jgi:hypothetical protein